MENYGYSLMATLLGMLVVFAFLSFLCLLMLSLKAFFRVGEGRGEKEEREGPQVEESQETDPAWLAAAVAAYLSLEEQGVSASVWEAGRGEPSDTWVSEGRFGSRRIGV